MDGLCSLFQNGPSKNSQALRHIFHCIDQVFYPNNAANNTCQDPNSLKNLRQGKSSWTTHKKMLGWIVNTLCLIFTLTNSFHTKV